MWSATAHFGRQNEWVGSELVQSQKQQALMRRQNQEFKNMEFFSPRLEIPPLDLEMYQAYFTPPYFAVVCPYVEED